MENILEKNVTRIGKIESDNSEFFAKWGSRNPELAICEEIDNQLGAQPTIASIDITNRPYGKCDILTYNDGITPSAERMEKMNCIGKSYSDKRGASVCGVGQIGGPVAGRCEPTSTSTLTFSSVHEGKESRFVCVANGTTYELTTENSGPFNTKEPDRVKKIFEGMREFSPDQLENIKLLAGIKIHPYSKEHPDFVFSMNQEIIKPIDILYEDVDDETIKRMPIKEYNVQYHNQTYLLKVGCADVARYVKPNGKTIDLTHANPWDAKHNLSLNSSGVFVELGGSMVICGGVDSWRLIDKKAHSTLNGIYIYISIPDEGELKEVLFAESPNKSTISIPFLEIRDYDGRQVFEEIINDIHKFVNSKKAHQETVPNGKNYITEKEAQEHFNKALNNSDFRIAFLLALSYLTEEQKNVLLKREIKTVINKINDYYKKHEKEKNYHEEIIEEVKSQSYAT